MDSVKIRIENAIYDLSSRFEQSDVASDVVSAGDVVETIVFPFLPEDLDIVTHLLDAGSGQVRLQGSDGHVDLEIAQDLGYSWFAALAMVEALGGDLPSN